MGGPFRPAMDHRACGIASIKGPVGLGAAESRSKPRGFRGPPTLFYDRSDNVPEMHRKDGYLYVPADEWDRRVTESND